MEHRPFWCLWFRVKGRKFEVLTGLPEIGAAFVAFGSQLEPATLQWCPFCAQSHHVGALSSFDLIIETPRGVPDPKRRVYLGHQPLWPQKAYHCELVRHACWIAWETTTTCKCSFGFRRVCFHQPRVSVYMCACMHVGLNEGLNDWEKNELLNGWRNVLLHTCMCIHVYSTYIDIDIDIYMYVEIDIDIDMDIDAYVFLTCIVYM